MEVLRSASAQRANAKICIETNNKCYYIMVNNCKERAFVTSLHVTIAFFILYVAYTIHTKGKIVFSGDRLVLGLTILAIGIGLYHTHLYLNDCTFVYDNLIKYFLT
jgi:hypothetical protein